MMFKFIVYRNIFNEIQTVVLCIKVDKIGDTLQITAECV